ncbi:hypothetical protein PCASD_20648 [Puccinia coronata f. sp. avenae]|uniref:Uncharacterized protein n=1 Tax=Puccinia coronata f. sp. avenae TaxID=200324 RepID=A0A2N5UDE9_9BASI|nr:hypothetical protein PCASD_20648 [Puccinia coronata f. sp. avenae]
MSDKNKKQTSDPISSTSEIPIQSGLSSPSIPNQTGKSTKERIDEQIGALKDVLAIPFLASPLSHLMKMGVKSPLRLNPLPHKPAKLSHPNFTTPLMPRHQRTLLTIT